MENQSIGSWQRGKCGAVTGKELPLSDPRLTTCSQTPMSASEVILSARYCSFSSWGSCQGCHTSLTQADGNGWLGPPSTPPLRPWGGPATNQVTWVILFRTLWLQYQKQLFLLCRSTFKIFYYKNSFSYWGLLYIVRSTNLNGTADEFWLTHRL